LTPFEEHPDDGTVRGASPQTPATRRFTAADVVILAAAAAFLGLTVVPSWYRVGGGKALGIPLPSYTFNAWRGTTMFAALLALLGLAWIGLRAGRVGPAVAADSVIDAALAGLCLLLTVLGTVITPDTGLGRASPSWALSVAIIAAGLWLYGALWRYREARKAGAASSGGSGFTGERPSLTRDRGSD
jgi:hypothetical protein